MKGVRGGCRVGRKEEEEEGRYGKREGVVSVGRRRGGDNKYVEHEEIMS
jgi:hypothetical protein